MDSASQLSPDRSEPATDDDRQTLDSRERYRALNAAMYEAYELVDLTNREGRFALILMSGLNAAVLVAGSRSELVMFLPPARRAWLAALLVVYAIVAIYFMLQAVSALRPGHFRPRLGDWPKDRADYPKGVRYFEDVIARDAEGYWKAWQDVTMEQLNAELAVQVHSLCIKNHVRRVALRRLYGGLRMMTFLFAALVALFIYAVWM